MTQKTIRKVLTSFVLLAGTASLVACSPTMQQRGNLLENEQLAAIKTNESTRSDVLQNLGSPTTIAPFDDKIWYYIGQETEKHGILDPKVTKERIVEVAFNDEGIVQSIQDVDNKRIDIPLERSKTPTNGNDMSAIKQILDTLNDAFVVKAGIAGRRKKTKSPAKRGAFVIP